MSEAIVYELIFVCNLHMWSLNTNTIHHFMSIFHIYTLQYIHVFFSY